MFAKFVFKQVLGASAMITDIQLPENRTSQNFQNIKRVKLEKKQDAMFLFQFKINSNTKWESRVIRPIR